MRKIRNNSFTLIELLIVLVIVGILTTLAVPQYQNYVEKAKGAEVYPIFRQFRIGYSARVQQGLPVDCSDGWNPCIGEQTNWCWEAIDMKNPNADPSRNFAIDYWPSWYAGGWDPVKSPRNIAIAFRRTTYEAYTYNLDASKWIYMDLDTGEVFKSGSY